MSVLERLRVMLHLSDAAGDLADASRQSIIAADDAARIVRFGDLDGQLKRANERAVELRSWAARLRG